MKTKMKTEYVSVYAHIVIVLPRYSVKHEVLTFFDQQVLSMQT